MRALIGKEWDPVPCVKGSQGDEAFELTDSDSFILPDEIVFTPITEDAPNSYLCKHFPLYPFLNALALHCIQNCNDLPNKHNALHPFPHLFEHFCFYELEILKEVFVSRPITRLKAKQDPTGYVKSITHGTEKTAHVKIIYCPTESLSSVSSTHVRWLTTDCNSSSRRIQWV